jgi:hypothetical protein
MKREPVDGSDKRVLVNGILMSLVTGLSFLSLLWRRSAGFAILAAGFLCFPLTYCLVQLEQRYRYPVPWMSVMQAAIVVELGFNGWYGAGERGREAASRPPDDWARTAKLVLPRS